MNHSNIQAGIDVISAVVQTLPPSPGVYRMLDINQNPLYVGKAKNLINRVKSYTKPDSLSYRIQRMISQTASMEIITTETEAEALLLEANLIKKLKPRYNILLRDDKTFPYILVNTEHDYPRISKHRGARTHKGTYFGPFASAYDVNQTIIHLQKIFLLRPCTDSQFASRTRPCLEYQIKRCSAPCVNKISPQAYDELVQEALAFLSGKSKHIQQKLTTLMEEASQAMDYELAANYRDRIRALTAIQAKQHINIDAMKDADVIGIHQENNYSCVEVFFFRGGQHFGNRAYFPKHTEEATSSDILESFIGQFYQTHQPPAHIITSHTLPHAHTLEQALQSMSNTTIHIHTPKRGDKKKVIDRACSNAKEALLRHLTETTSHNHRMQQLGELLAINTPLHRIEVYDNSHNQGTFPVGAMIVLGMEGFNKPAYRRFTIKSNPNPGDDYAMMREVFTRRFTRLLKEYPTYEPEHWPDLLIVDGGQGHLTTVQEILQEFNLSIPLLCISKGPERKVGAEQFHMPDKESFTLPPDNPIAHFIQHARDEAHRYAIGSHRNKRSKSVNISSLDDIPGIGAKRKKALLTHFGSVKSIAAAGIEDLMQAEGISKAMAQMLYDYFH